VPPPREAAPPSEREAQIATERAERKRREELDKAEAAKKQREADEQKRRDAEEQKKRELDAARKKAVEQARLDKTREEQLQRMLGSLEGNGSPKSTGTAARDSAPSAGYAGKLIARIKSNIVFADTVPGNPSAEVEVRATASGTIMSSRLLKSSGVKDYDEAVLRAIDKTGSLPPDTDGRVPPQLIITFKLNE